EAATGPTEFVGPPERPPLSFSTALPSGYDWKAEGYQSADEALSVLREAEARVAMNELYALERQRADALTRIADAETSQKALTAEQQTALREDAGLVRALNYDIEHMREGFRANPDVPISPPDLNDANLGPAMMTLGSTMTSTVVPNVLNGRVAGGFAAAGALGVANGTGFATALGLTEAGLSESMVRWMLDQDTATSASIKLTTPGLAMERSGIVPMGALADAIPLGTLEVPGGAKGKLKLQGWATGTATVALTRPAMSDGKPTVRTMTVSYMAGLQAENSMEVALGPYTPKSVTQPQVGAVYSYSITAPEERLEEILYGRAPLPDLNDPATLKDGDTITWDMSGLALGDTEIRALYGKSMLKAGADFKFDARATSGQRTVVRIRDNAETGDRHAIVFDGNSYMDRMAMGVGAVYNPSIPKDGKGAAAKLSSITARALIEGSTQDVDNHFRFAEYNIGRSKGLGLYQDYMQTGILPANLVALEAPDAITAHGLLDFSSGLEELGLRASFTLENKRSTTQLSGNGYYNLATSGDIDRRFILADAQENSVLRGGETPSTSAAVFAFNVEQGRNGVSNAHVDINGNNRYLNSKSIYVTDDGATYKIEEKDYIAGYGVNERDIKTLLERDLEIRQNGGKGIFDTIEVVAADGSVITGQAAHDYLDGHKDPQSGWFTPERVNIILKPKDSTDWRDFSERLARDSETYLDDTWFLNAITPNAVQGQAVSYAMNRLFGTGGISGNNMFQLSEYVGNAHDATAQGGSLINAIPGFLDIAPSLIEGSSAGSDPYPLTLHIYAPKDGVPIPPAASNDASLYEVIQGP
ncbi:MAG: hypothetical protein KDI98_02090, partial [Hyphomicrobiaceae bacterium]|nr:hypothetical protein [Hyphomicrobiaceae bacterium]